MSFHYRLICLALSCLPAPAPAQGGYYYVESSCAGCRLTANGKPAQYEFISDEAQAFVFGGNERELELIVAEFRAGLAAEYANYAELVENAAVHSAPDRKAAEEARRDRMEAMRGRGYQVLERSFWLISHRAIPAVDEYLTFAARFGFDGVALIAENDWVVHRRGYGRAREIGELANCPPVAFPIGTMTEAFTAQVILLMQEAGRLRLSDNLGRIFRGIPADKRLITINQLLTHTSGLEQDVILKGGDKSGAAALDAILKSKLYAVPGERYHYSQAGYQLLALIIQKITRTPYDQFLREQILTPFQLAQTGFYHQPPEKTLIADGGMAVSPQPFRPRQALSYAYLGGEGLIMTADDLFRWFRSVSKLPIFFEMTRPRLDIKRSHGFSTHKKLTTAEGEAGGYHAHLSYDPSRSRVIILLSNSGLAYPASVAETLTRNIHKIMDKQSVKWIEERAMEREGCDGVYVNGQDTLRVDTERGRLKILFSGGRLVHEIAKMAAEPETADTAVWRFALPTAERTLTCFDLATEQTRELRFSQDLRAVWVGDLKLERAEE